MSLTITLPRTAVFADVVKSLETNPALIDAGAAMIKAGVEMRKRADGTVPDAEIEEVAREVRDMIIKLPALFFAAVSPESESLGGHNLGKFLRNVSGLPVYSNEETDPCKAYRIVFNASKWSVDVTLEATSSLIKTAIKTMGVH